MSLPGWNPRHGRAQPEVNQGRVPGGQVPLRTLQKRAFALRRTGRGLFLFPLMGTSWEQPADRGSDQGVPTWEQNGRIMAFLEQRPRGDGGITARVIWRQDGQRAAEKFAPNSRHSPF